MEKSSMIDEVSSKLRHWGDALRENLFHMGTGSEFMTQGDSPTGGPILPDERRADVRRDLRREKARTFSLNQRKIQVDLFRQLQQLSIDRRPYLYSEGGVASSRLCSSKKIEPTELPFLCLEIDSINKNHNEMLLACQSKQPVEKSHHPLLLSWSKKQGIKRIFPLSISSKVIKRLSDCRGTNTTFLQLAERHFTLILRYILSLGDRFIGNDR
ncbi:hypothetical protein RND71_026623 [Anisodus tanguticus]|uniref:Uncharacterized protein n=1 Tax=Anisodus tanguticus TaxID=243964 RepID=A0AAE1VAP0_9SOLA|nr:hypothetical protein RND71_026623 [Anisodus tanguticus]